MRPSIKHMFLVTMLLAASAMATAAPTQDTTTAAPSEPLWGAMYFPADAYNAWQLWHDYNRSVIERDMQYARSVNVNAVRVFLSYEYWRDNPDAFADRFDHFLNAAGRNGITVLPVLFESIGADPTAENVQDDALSSSFAVRSPSWSYMIVHAVLRQWTQYLGERMPADFTAWMTDRYGTDDRVVAVEIMNEPGNKPLHYPFANDMLQVAQDANPDAALTMGSRELRFNTRYRTELDVHQFHHNLPVDADDMAQYLDRAERHRERHGKPVWLTEWQRTRQPAPPQDDFPENHSEYPQKMLPNYESLAPQLRDAVSDRKIDGAFLWGLMVKPAYICTPRTMGRINGLFYPDGTVYDVDDAWAVAGNDTVQLEERQELPTGMDRFRQHSPDYCGGL